MFTSFVFSEKQFLLILFIVILVSILFISILVVLIYFILLNLGEIFRGITELLTWDLSIVRCWHSSKLPVSYCFCYNLLCVSIFIWLKNFWNFSLILQWLIVQKYIFQVPCVIKFLLILLLMLSILIPLWTEKIQAIISLNHFWKLFLFLIYFIPIFPSLCSLHFYFPTLNVTVLQMFSEVMRCYIMQKISTKVYIILAKM